MIDLYFVFVLQMRNAMMKISNKSNSSERSVNGNSSSSEVLFVDNIHPMSVDQQLERYQHFIKCPSCQSSNHNRNQVLIPCGHLVCNQCVRDHPKKCVLCDGDIERVQILCV